jgi:iron complex outermembrane receptor protein
MLVVMMDMFLLLKRPKDYNATIGFKSVLNDWNIDASFTTGGNSQTYKVNQSHNRNFVYVPYNTTTGEFDATSLYREQ